MRYLLMSKLIQFHINNEAQNFIFFILKVGTRLHDKCPRERMGPLEIDWP